MIVSLGGPMLLQQLIGLGYFVGKPWRRRRFQELILRFEMLHHFGQSCRLCLESRNLPACIAQGGGTTNDGAAAGRIASLARQFFGALTGRVASGRGLIALPCMHKEP